MLDFCNAQQGRNYGQRLVEAGDRLIDHHPKFLRRCSVLAPTLEAHPHAGERRAQVMRDVVANPGNLVNESFDLLQHAVHYDGELVKRVIDPTGREPLSQITGDDALDSLVDLFDPLLCTNAKEAPRRDA